MIPYLRHAIPNEPLAARRAQHVHFRVTDEITESQLGQFVRLLVVAASHRREALHDGPLRTVGEERVGVTVALEVAERRAREWHGRAVQASPSLSTAFGYLPFTSG